MEVNLSLLIAVAALCLSVLFTTVLWIVSRRSNARLTEALAQQQQQLSALKKQLHINASTLEEIQARSLVVAKNTEQTEATLAALQQQFTALGEQDPDSRLYQRAAEMIQSGASAEEVMHNCDLPLAEVQLLMNIHQPK